MRLSRFGFGALGGALLAALVWGGSPEKEERAAASRGARAAPDEPGDDAAAAGARPLRRAGTAGARVAAPRAEPAQAETESAPAATERAAERSSVEHGMRAGASPRRTAGRPPSELELYPQDRALVDD